MAQHRHKRETPAAPSPRPSRVPRSVLVSAPLAVVATLSVVTMGVLGAEPAARAAAAESFVYFMEGASVHERCKDVARPHPCGDPMVRDDPRAVPPRRDVP